MFQGTFKVNDTSVKISYPGGEYTIALLDHLMVCTVYCVYSMYYMYCVNCVYDCTLLIYVYS